MGSSRRNAPLLGIGFLLILFQPAADCQQESRRQADPAVEAPGSQNPPESEPKRIFGIIPNYRSSPMLATYEPLTVSEKFKIATNDSFDRGSVILGAALGGVGQLTNSNPSFGQGVKGYAHYFATSYADVVIGDYMTEAIFPTLLRQDPRYFRLGHGGGRKRLGHAVGMTFWTRVDSGGRQFNFSEILGNSTAVAISNAYYPDSRTAADAATRLGTQVGVDMLGNILKEFWPDVYHHFSKKRRAAPPQQ